MENKLILNGRFIEKQLTWGEFMTVYFNWIYQIFTYSQDSYASSLFGVFI